MKLTALAVVHDVLSVLPCPHDVGLGIADRLAGKGHVRGLTYNHVRARLLGYERRRHCHQKP